MLSRIIKPRKHLSQIIKILFRYGLNSDNLEIVTSTFSWASTRSIKSVGRDILAFSTIETNKETNKQRKIIVLLEEMSLDDVECVLSRIDYPITKPIKHLRSDDKFIEHLVLHEIGHIVKGLSQLDEEEADNFAFREMKLM